MDSSKVEESQVHAMDEVALAASEHTNGSTVGEEGPENNDVAENCDVIDSDSDEEEGDETSALHGSEEAIPQYISLMREVGRHVASNLPKHVRIALKNETRIPKLIIGSPVKMTNLEYVCRSKNQLNIEKCLKQ